MSQETNAVVDVKSIDWSNVPVQVDPTTGEEYQSQDGIRLTVESFEKLPGSRFNNMAFEKLEAVHAFFTEDKILDLINIAVSNAIRIKARNRIPKYDDAEQTKAFNAKVAQEGITLFSAADCMNFVPGERELTSSGYMNLAKKLLKEGKKEQAMAALDRARDLMLSELS